MSSDHKTWGLTRGRATWLLCGSALALAGGLLPGCGKDAPSNAKGPPGSESNPLTAVPNPQRTRTPPTDDDSGGRQTAAQLAAGKDPEGARAPKTKSSAGSTTSGRSKSSGKRTLPLTSAVNPRKPCTLVTKAQAQAMIGAPIVEPLEAPQGPTCIYRSRSGKSFVTLAIQRANFTKLRKQMRNSRRVAISAQTAYCGTLGQPVLYVPLSRERVLSIAAPCALASRFAERAVPRLKG